MEEKYPKTHIALDNKHLTLCAYCTCDFPNLQFVEQGKEDQATCEGCAGAWRFERPRQ